MRMNALIPLQADVPDVVGSLDRGSTAGRRAGMADLYREHGAGIMAGNQNALAALAGMDPQAALGVRDAHQAMQARSELMGQRRAASGRAAAVHEQKMSEKEIHDGLVKAATVLSQAENPEQFDQMARTAGMPDLVGQFEQRDVLLYEKVLPPLQQLELRAKNAQGTQPDWKIVDGQAIDQNDPMRGAQPIPGLERKKKDMTESERRIFMFNSMQKQTGPAINTIEENGFDPSNIQDKLANGVLGGNFFKSTEGQMYESAAGAWSESALRLATGAAATPEEYTRIRGMYFAQVGDTPETIEFKRAMRTGYEQVLAATLRGDLDAQIDDPVSYAVKQFYAAQSAPEPPEDPSSADGEVPPMPDTFSEGEDLWKWITPEQRQLWLN